MTFDTNSLAYDRSIRLEQLEEARNNDVGSAGLAASHINNRASDDMVAQEESGVKSEHQGKNEKMKK